MPSHALILALLGSFVSVSASFDCADVVNQRVKWNLKELGGPRTVHWVWDEEPSIHNFTFELDICKPIGRHKGVPAQNECAGGTRGRFLVW